MNAMSKPPVIAGATVKRDDLVRAMALLAKVVERRSTIPILSHVMVTAASDGVAFTGTNTEVAVTVRLDADGAGFACTASASRLLALVRALPSGADVSLHADDERMHVRCDTTAAKFHSMPVADFPVMTTAEQTQPLAVFNIGADVLRGLLERAARFMSTEGTRYYLNGVHLMRLNGELRVVATDGHRLAMLKAPLPAGAEAMPECILPRDAVNLLRAMLAADRRTDTVAVVMSKERARFTLGRVELDTKFVDGVFPDVYRVVPAESGEPMRVATRPFRDAIILARSMNTERNAPTKLGISADVMRVSMEGVGEGEVSAVVPIQGGPVKPIEIGFQSRYLLNILACIGGDALLQNFRASGGDPRQSYSQGDPCRIHDSADPRAIYVLMPMRL